MFSFVQAHRIKCLFLLHAHSCPFCYYHKRKENYFRENVMFCVLKIGAVIQIFKGFRKYNNVPNSKSIMTLILHRHFKSSFLHSLQKVAYHHKTFSLACLTFCVYKRLFSDTNNLHSTKFLNSISLSNQFNCKMVWNLLPCYI